MNTLEMSSNGLVGPAMSQRLTLRKGLLVCGILSSLLYVATNVLGALRWKGYSLTAQTISELSAIGAPSRPLVVPLTLAYDVLLIAFGVGVWKSAGQKRALRVVGGLLVGHGIVNVAAPPFASMHQREVLAAGGATLSDALHLGLAAVCALSFLIAIAFGATAFGKRFRLYSIATMLALVVFGALTGMGGPQVEANLPTPWIGVWERISVFSFMLWAVALAVALWHGPADRSKA